MASLHAPSIGVEYTAPAAYGPIHRPGYSLGESNVLSIKGSVRALTARITREMPEGVTRENGRLEGDHMLITDRQVKYTVWALDSMLWAFERAIAGEWILAFRGYAQAQGYLGMLDGMGVRLCGVDGEVTTLRNLMEHVIGQEAPSRW